MQSIFSVSVLEKILSLASIRTEPLHLRMQQVWQALLAFRSGRDHMELLILDGDFLDFEILCVRTDF
jgi:hypothetical protein